MIIFPEEGFSSNPAMFNKVLLPDPDGPVSEHITPLSKEKDKSSKTLTKLSFLPYEYDMFLHSNILLMT